MQPSHVVLLGDSIFDNGAYTSGGPDAAAQIQPEIFRVGQGCAAGKNRQQRGCRGGGYFQLPHKAIPLL